MKTAVAAVDCALKRFLTLHVKNLQGLTLHVKNHVKLNITQIRNMYVNSLYAQYSPMFQDDVKVQHIKKDYSNYTRRRLSPRP